MSEAYNVKAAANEKEYPNIVEVAVGSQPLDVDLSRRIMLFHKLRHIEPRHGRRVNSNNRICFRWCFSELTTAHEFIEQFGGSLIENSLIASPSQ
jgi:hypothetical protein